MSDQTPPGGGQSGTSSSANAAPTKQPFLGPWQAVTLLMVLLSLLAVVLLSLAKFDDSSDVVAVLGVVVAPIVSIAAAAFGVSIAAEKAGEAGAAEGKAVASAANANAEQANASKAAAAVELDRLGGDVETLLSSVERLGASPIGASRYRLDVVGESGERHTAEFSADLVRDIRQRVTRARQILQGP